jgi:hypothetical protein
MTSTFCRALAPAVIAAAVALPAHAQPSPNASPGVSPGANPVCTRLETQLQTFDRGANDPSRAEQMRRYEEAAASQQNEIERQQVLARRMGCGGSSFFVLFNNEPAQCGPQNAKIQQMRANLEKINSDLAILERGGNAAERESQRHAILVALAQNNCGPQYRAAAAAAQPRSGLFETLFGGRSVFSGGGDSGWNLPSGSYRTICVRTCDGYFYPISFATSQDRFAEDEKTCRKSCPAAEVMLFAHRNPGEDVSQAVSTGGQLYSSLPNAFRFRQAFDQSCSCRRPGESWANALRNIEDSTVEAGDIVVNEQRSRQMSQPRVDAQGRPIAPPPPAPRSATRAATPGAAAPAQAPAAAPAPEAKSEEPPQKPDPNRPVRAVGPTFLPGR